MNNTPLYFHLSDADLCVNFFDSSINSLAMTHLCLQEKSRGQTIGTIDYILDARMSDLVQEEYPPNAVYIRKEDLPGEGRRIILKMYNQYTVALDSQGTKVSVRYPANIPASMLVDDVFQAALSPLLMQSGGFILHGSCVVQDDAAIAIMGLSGSGKSATAYTLTNYGFQCYSDDAVIVFPDKNNNQLNVYPLDREISIRPLSFRLYDEQNFHLGEYRKEGEKYYFPLDQNKSSGAALRYICFASVSGESETTVNFLTPEQMVDVLVSEEKHFTFFDRENAPALSAVLRKMVPNSFQAFIGTDIEQQGKIFNAVIKEDFSFPNPRPGDKIQDGRSKKKSLFQAAWADPATAPLKTIIPFLVDYDRQIIQLAHSFFQTWPLAKIEPVARPQQLVELLPDHFEADWLHATDWLHGCTALVSGYRPEVFEKFAISWIVSAPLLFPFLYAATFDHPKKAKRISSAWETFTKERQSVAKKSYRIVKASFSQHSNQWKLLAGSGKEIHSSDLESSHVVCLFDETKQSDPATMSGMLNSLAKAASCIAVPICRPKKDMLTLCVEFIRQAVVDYGLEGKLFRHLPLCSLRKADADFLLDVNAFQVSSNDPCLPSRLLEKINKKNKSPMFFDGSVIENTYPSCFTCGLYPLGLCRGGFFLNKEKR